MPVQKVKLPYPYQQGEITYRIEGWSAVPGRLLVSFPGKHSSNIFTRLEQEESTALLFRLGLTPENIQGYIKPKEDTKTEYVSGSEWDEFQRWKQKRRELEELADDNLANWKELLNTITEKYPEFDEEFDDLFEGLRKHPRLLRFVRTGDYPSMDMDDEDLSYYDEGVYWNKQYTETKKHKTIIKVIIEDISNGKL